MRRRPSGGIPAAFACGEAGKILSPTLLGLPNDIPTSWEAIPNLFNSKLNNLQSDTALYKKLTEIWDKTSRGPFPPNKLTRIQLIHAGSMEQAWIGASESYLNSNPPPNPKVEVNMNKPEAQIGEANLRRLCMKKTELGARFKQSIVDPKFIFVWHGGPFQYLHRIACTGPRKLRNTDGGFFGAGIYTTPEAWYASMYSAIDADPNIEQGVILFAATVGKPYVITRESDYPHPHWTNEGEPVSKFFSPDPHQGIALMPGVDTHYVACKAPTKSFNFQACREAEAQCHEVVLDSVSQLCPIAIFYYKPN